MKRCVVIPSYKAAATLRGVIETLPEALLGEGNGVVIVNDCSPDETGAIADALATEFPGVHAVHHPKNKGYGGALKTGMSHGFDLGFDIFAIVHSDGQYAPEMVLELCDPIEKGLSEIVQGSRMKGGARKGEHPMPLTRYLPNRFLTILENAAFGTNMAEFHSGYMIYSRKLLGSVPYKDLQNNYNFDAEMIIMAHLAGMPCSEVPIPTKYDDETSSLNPIPYGLNVLKMILRYKSGHYCELLESHQTYLRGTDA